MAVLVLNDGFCKTEVTSAVAFSYLNPRIIALLSSWERATMFCPASNFIFDLVVAGEYKMDVTLSDARMFKQRVFGTPGVTVLPSFTFDVQDQWLVSELVPLRVLRAAALTLVFGSNTVFATKITIDKL